MGKKKNANCAYLGVNAIWVIDGTIVLNDTNAFGTGTRQIAASVQADITETLNDVGLAAPAGS